MSDFFNQLQEATLPAREAMLSAPIIAACAQGNINLVQYQAFLTQAYHHVKHTVPLLMACGARLGEEKEWLRVAIAEYIEEEIGHHEWILNDIRACGGSADDVRHNQNDGAVCPAIELMVAYLYHQIDRGNPLALFGMVWVLEGTSVGIGGQVAQQVKRTLNLQDDALTYLTSHSELDQEHIQFFARLMNRISDPDEQQVIIRSANMVFQLYGQMLQTLTQ
ncbi:iron-containing redox enzyme family protein [Vibrio rhizosphaerae]|uniref:Iron-containing redox enzyme family protein n=1 Tax=Vibrio rhizosphaerae TaxID=398736 RepID=A0ABU4IZD9_9VIBR|nr:iron-containing redox enzyme family protein [Vibrio rhizosphaerae]MDW6094634.1 iron-containing redox enzyme family protein [Vibrio rhizosphaerae]